MTPEQEYFEYVIKGIVDHPEAVVIERTIDTFGVLLTLTVHPEDMGKVIGKDGEFATKALRPLLKRFGMKHNARIALKITEPVGGKREIEEGGVPEVKTVDQVVDEM